MAGGEKDLEGVGSGSFAWYSGSALIFVAILVFCGCQHNKRPVKDMYQRLTFNPFIVKIVVYICAPPSLLFSLSQYCSVENDLSSAWQHSLV